jgi:transportin-1
MDFPSTYGIFNRMRSQKLNHYTRAPDYIAYLAYILAAMTLEEDRIRTIAGYLLKNNSRLILSASPEVAAYVKASVLQAFEDSSVMIRSAAGQDIVAFLGALEPKNWPECLQKLVNMLDSADLERQEVSILIHFLLLMYCDFLDSCGFGLSTVER